MALSIVNRPHWWWFSNGGAYKCTHTRRFDSHGGINANTHCYTHFRGFHFKYDSFASLLLVFFETSIYSTPSCIWLLNLEITYTHLSVGLHKIPLCGNVALGRRTWTWQPLVTPEIRGRKRQNCLPDVVSSRLLMKTAYSLHKTYHRLRFPYLIKVFCLITDKSWWLNAFRITVRLDFKLLDRLNETQNTKKRAIYEEWCFRMIPLPF